MVKIELFKIGNSEIAPHFEIISQPNDWTKTIRSNQSNTELTGMKLVDLNFWQGFSEYLSDNRTTFSIRKAQPQHWYSLAIGSSDCHIDLTVNKTVKLLVHYGLKIIKVYTINSLNIKMK